MLEYRQVWAIVVARFVTDPVWWLYITWLPLYLANVRGFSLRDIGMFAWVPFVTADAGSLVGGWVSGHMMARGCTANFARKSVMVAGTVMMMAGIPAGLARSAGAALDPQVERYATPAVRRCAQSLAVRVVSNGGTAQTRGPSDHRGRKERQEMIERALGNAGPRVSALGLGCMGMSDLYGPADEGESIATIHASLDSGMTLLDTGDYYGMGHNELLVRRALEGRPRDRVVLSVKFGALRDPSGAWIGIDTRPAAAKNFLAYTLRRLGTDYVDIYRPGRLDPSVPVEETVGAIADLIKAGYVRYVGLSEVGTATLRRAHAVHPVSDLQIEYSLMSRGIEQSILPAARDLGVGITAYGVLSRGLLSGHWSADRPAARGDFRAFLPRFCGDNLARNLALVESLRLIAEERRMTVAQLAIAWVLSRDPRIVPLVGARRRDRLTEALGALDVELSPQDLARLEQVLPSDAVAGSRYDAHQMQILDSERRP